VDYLSCLTNCCTLDTNSIHCSLRYQRRLDLAWLIESYILRHFRYCLDGFLRKKQTKDCSLDFLTSAWKSSCWYYDGCCDCWRCWRRRSRSSAIATRVGEDYGLMHNYCSLIMMVESSLLGWAWIGLVIWSRSFETMRNTTEDEGTTSYAVPEKCLRGSHVKT
jgi:hypothetical protein